VPPPSKIEASKTHKNCPVEKTAGQFLSFKRFNLYMNAFCCDKALRKNEHEPGFAGCAVICLTYF
jgi:hypothetical protein